LKASDHDENHRRRPSGGAGMRLEPREEGREGMWVGHLDLGHFLSSSAWSK
jgi:hypothetical protein